MRLPAYVYRCRHGVYFFRTVVPQELKKALSGQREIKRSLRTRDKRQAVVQARSLALNLYPVFARAAGMSRQPSPPSIDDILARAEALRKRTLTRPVVLPDVSTTPCTVKTDSESPRELKAAEDASARLLSLHLAFTHQRNQPTPEVQAALDKERQELRDIVFTSVKADAQAARSAAQDNGAAKFVRHAHPTGPAASRRPDAGRPGPGAGSG